MKASTEMEDVEKLEKYVNDPFFEKGHFWLKFRQIILTIISWIFVVVPVYWTLSATVFVNKNFMRTVWSYAEGRDIFYSYGHFFIIAFIVLAIVTILFTLHNNHYTKQHVKKITNYDEKRLMARRNAIKDFYTEEFGEVNNRRNNVRYYSVSPQQNLDVDTIDKIYKQFEETK
ncbi:hypothetical protein [Companilactobacillus mishanensis]|uniref:Poly-beta-1,6-N-acetyl-D-glucosamine biosynthesis protein PgaD n=1 Tax=Companilactobacillus mishanensis TaxID=2486008 RepID=A0A5P0ZEQ7_9LACO|nr:hypothetical protein [Companilactobacillus mishanensis]MQS44357.1 hypothetical protein [Companilactobacillus mishanensis]MQS51541.1 hypothetical protein [Companilactobacillus mishanensis]MQS88597.1 hypothetical protein [Companilactobacillus mishanensis]